MVSHLDMPELRGMAMARIDLPRDIVPKVVEPVCSHILWRLIKIHRGGRRSFQQKCRLISEGLNDGQLCDQYPYILDENYVIACLFPMVLSQIQP